MSAKETSATARPPVRIGPRLSRGTSGRRGAGSPCGNGPSTETPARAARSNAATTTVAAATAISMPGIRGHRFSTRISASALPPIARAVTLVLPVHTLLDDPHTSGAAVHPP